MRVLGAPIGSTNLRDIHRLQSLKTSLIYELRAPLVWKDPNVCTDPCDLWAELVAAPH